MHRDLHAGVIHSVFIRHGTIERMHMKRSYRYVALAIVAIVLCLFVVIILNSSNGVFAERQVRADVTSFGTVLKDVSLLGPDASSSMRTAYEPYITEELLATWQKDPEHAPGRLTSSPWPDHVTIESISRQGNSYIVAGSLVSMTDAGESGSTPFVAQVVQVDGSWKIAAFQEQATQ